MHAPAQQDVSREASRLEDKLSPSSKPNVSSMAPMLRVPAQPGAKAGPAAAAACSSVVVPCPAQGTCARVGVVLQLLLSVLHHNAAL